jgi:predicted membrane protein
MQENKIKFLFFLFFKKIVFIYIRLHTQVDIKNNKNNKTNYKEEEEEEEEESEQEEQSRQGGPGRCSRGRGLPG